MICLDTAILIWGIRGSASRTQEHMTSKARRYIEHLEMQAERIMIPTPVLAEYFVGATATERHEMEIMERGFVFPPLDVPSALIAADLMRDIATTEEVKDETGLDIQSIKSDTFIIAIAIQHRATRIITHDSHFRKLARNRIAISELPDIVEQGELTFKDPT